MSGNIYEVRPGPPQQLQGSNLGIGSTIYNTDLINSVWVSSKSNMSPGNGFEITPQASLEWNSKEGVPWACVDTGATENVRIQYSDDVSNVQNPVGVALAISAAGIPIKASQSVLLNDEIFPVHPGSVSLDVSEYNSIIIACDVAYQYQFQTEEFSGIIIDADRFKRTDSNARLACLGNWLSIFNQDTIDGTLTVVGSSRQALGRLDTRFLTSNGDFWLLNSTAMTNGNTYPLVQQTLGTVLQGETAATFFVSGQTVTGFFILSCQDGTLQKIDICDTTMMTPTASNAGRTLQTTLNLPPGGYDISFSCGGTGGTANASVRMTSGNVP